MTRLFSSGLAAAFLSVRTVFCVILVGAFCVFNLAQMSKVSNANMWDVLLPTLTDSSTVSVIGLTWWFLWLLPSMRALSQEQTLIRYGSRARAVLANLVALLGALCSWALLLLITCGAITIALGLSSTWSEYAFGVNTLQTSAYSSTAIAQFFPSPWLAIVASGMFTGFGYLAVASVALSLTARGYHLYATVGLTLFIIWSFVCSFSLIPLPSLLDASVSLSLPWALSMPQGVWAAIFWFTTSFAFTAMVTLPFRSRMNIQEFLNSRLGLLLSLSFIALIYSLYVALDGATIRSPIREFFAGTYGGIVGYVAVAVIPLGFATSYVARLSNSMHGPIFYHAIRLGGYRRWLMRFLLDEILPAIVLCVLVGFILIATLVVTGHPISLFSSDGVDLGVGLLGLLVTIALQLAIGSALAWMGASTMSSWPIAVGASLVVGYSIPAALSSVNILAPYSLSPDFNTVSAPISSIVTTVLISSILAGVVVTLATPSRVNPAAL